MHRNIHQKVHYGVNLYLKEVIRKPSVETAMTISEDRKEVSERLRMLIQRVTPTTGRFSTLEQISGISASRWKNFYYRKQAASPEMVEFWCKKYPNEELYLRTGKLDESDPKGVWEAPTPKNWEGQTIGDRLAWVIAQWAAPQGASLFSYLEQRSQNTVPADEWASVIMRLTEPTLRMVQVVCEARPLFTEWVITGSATQQPSVDPTSRESTTAYWKSVDKTQEKIIKKLMKSNDERNQESQPSD